MDSTSAALPFTQLSGSHLCCYCSTPLSGSHLCCSSIHSTLWVPSLLLVHSTLWVPPLLLLFHLLHYLGPTSVSADPLHPLGPISAAIPLTPLFGSHLCCCCSTHSTLWVPPLLLFHSLHSLGLTSRTVPFTPLSGYHLCFCCSTPLSGSHL